MFGYVRVHHPELKVKEYEFYRGTYCGLCRAMGKCTGQCSRMTLSYDFAFLALLRIALKNEEVSFEQKRCLVHPLKKRSSMKRNPALDYCAGAAAILNYHKLKDDLEDEKGFKRLRAILAYPAIAHARKKALRMELEPLDRAIKEGLDRLAELEKQREASVDAPADRFGEILGEIVSYDLGDPEARIARTLGQSVGKWIYAADALDDWREDAERKRYNPFLILYGKDAPTAEEAEGIRAALKNELYAAEAAMDLMDTENPTVRAIIENVLYLGLPHKAEQIKPEQDPKDKKRNDRKKRSRKDVDQYERSL